MKNEKIIIYTDGACSDNQNRFNKGGWGAVLSYKDKIKKIHGGAVNTTNNRMELTACIKALEALKVENAGVEIHSDSAYIVNCFRQHWYEKWRKNGWKTASKQPVENQDLWIQLLELVEKHRVEFHKVKGHAGIKYNELADRLANQGIQEA